MDGVITLNKPKMYVVVT